MEAVAKLTNVPSSPRKMRVVADLIRGERVNKALSILKFEPKVYYLLHKPKKVVCTNYDPQGRTRAIDLLSRVKQRIYPVGRLDTDSKGLLIMTNDGELAQKLTHPRFGVSKTYVAEIAGSITGAEIEKLKKGMYLPQGKASVENVKIMRRGPKRSMLEITLREGRNRQVRRMLARLGHPVRQLTRVRIGRLTLRGLGPGKYRPLKPAEVNALRGLSQPTEMKTKPTRKKRVRNQSRK